MDLKNKMDENGVVIKNKARLVAQAYMVFMVYQMDVKSANLNGKISEEVYVQQPPGFESSEFPNHVCKLDKALYGLKQAPRACALVKCPMLPPNNLGPDESRVSVNVTLFRGMIGSLMYLTASRPDIQFSTCLCARYQANPKESHLVAIKRIFRYLKGTPNLCLWYPKGSGFDLNAYSDSDYAGCNLDRKSTSGGCQILGGKLLADYDVLYDKIPIFCDNTSAIAISNNPVLHSRTKHIDIRYHFIRDHILKGDIDLHFVPTDLQLADIFTKPLAEPSFTRLVAELGMLNIEKQVSDKKKALSDSLTYILNVFKLHPLTVKKERKSNICYTRYLSLILEHLLGEAYTNENLKTFKPHHIIALSFKPTLENETALTAHMCKVVELSPDPIKSLLPPSGEVNANNLADKSSFGTSVKPIIQPKAPTD
ncbi:retrovirus-related pol polyprotein from transposon TNT 1-94 [Tanacetum coccineum]